MENLLIFLKENAGKEFDCMLDGLAIHGKILLIFNRLYFMEVLVIRPNAPAQQVPIIEVEDTDMAKITDLVLHTTLSPRDSQLAPEESSKEKVIPIANIDDIVKFGKYKSQDFTWRQLLKEDYSYVNWVHDNVSFVKLSDEIISKL